MMVSIVIDLLIDFMIMLIINSTVVFAVTMIMVRRRIRVRRGEE